MTINKNTTEKEIKTALKKFIAQENQERTDCLQFEIFKTDCYGTELEQSIYIIDCAENYMYIAYRGYDQNENAIATAFSNKLKLAIDDDMMLVNNQAELINFASYPTFKDVLENGYDNFEKYQIAYEEIADFNENEAETLKLMSV